LLFGGQLAYPKSRNGRGTKPNIRAAMPTPAGRNAFNGSNHYDAIWKFGLNPSEFGGSWFRRRDGQTRKADLIALRKGRIEQVRELAFAPLALSQRNWNAKQQGRAGCNFSRPRGPEARAGT
jgi:hypothetical protein